MSTLQDLVKTSRPKFCCEDSQVLVKKSSQSSQSSRNRRTAACCSVMAMRLLDNGCRSAQESYYTLTQTLLQRIDIGMYTADVATTPTFSQYFDVRLKAIDLPGPVP